MKKKDQKEDNPTLVFRGKAYSLSDLFALALATDDMTVRQGIIDLVADSVDLLKAEQLKMILKDAYELKALSKPKLLEKIIKTCEEERKRLLEVNANTDSLKLQAKLTMKSVYEAHQFNLGFAKGVEFVVSKLKELQK